MGVVIEEVELPLPQSLSSRLSSLEKGKSLRVVGMKRDAVRVTIQRAQARLNRKFTMRNLGDNTFGIWRTE